MWRLATVFPTNRARVAALVVYAAVPLTPGVDLDRTAHRAGRLRRGAVVRPPAPRCGRDRHGRPGVAGRRPGRRDLRALDPRAGAPHGRARGRHGDRRRRSPRARPPGRGARRRPARRGHARRRRGGAPRPGWAGSASPRARARSCSTCRGRSRGRGTTSSRPTLAGAPGRGLVDVASMAIGQARLEVLALALYVPVLIAPRHRPRVAVHVGRARRLPRRRLRRAGGPAGSRRAAVAGARRRGAARARGARGWRWRRPPPSPSFGRDVAGRTFGWRQPAGVLALGAVAVGVFPAVLTLTDGAWFAPRTHPRRRGRGAAADRSRDR